MRASAIRPGDVVEVNIRGCVFRALVLEGPSAFPDKFPIRALKPGFRGWHSVTPREVHRRLYRPPRRVRFQERLFELNAERER